MRNGKRRSRLKYIQLTIEYWTSGMVLWLIETTSLLSYIWKNHRLPRKPTPEEIEEGRAYVKALFEQQKEKDDELMDEIFAECKKEDRKKKYCEYM